MKNKRISESLDRAMADSTWKEKNREHVLQQIHNPGKTAYRPMRQRIVMAAAFALALVLCMATALAAFNEDANMLLYRFWPEAARALRPVNLSCEEAGIRMEVLSASAADDSVLVIYSMTDLQGRGRINELSSVGGFLTLLDIMEYEGEGNGRMLSYDPEKQQAVFASYWTVNIKTDPDASINGMLEFEVDDLDIPSIEMHEISQITSGLEYAAEAVPAPNRNLVVYNTDETCSTGSAKTPVLNPANSLEIPLMDGYSLSGIGYIDGILHVQVRRFATQSVSESSYLYSIAMLDRDGNQVRPIDRLSDYPNGEFFISWGDEESLWDEYLFPIPEDEADQYKIFIRTTRYTESEELKDHRWVIRFPASMIKNETGE